MVEAIRPDVYRLDLSDDRDLRAYLLDAEAPTLIDAGLPATADRLLAELDAAPVDSPTRAVITHADPDHVGGLSAVVDAHDPTVRLPEQSDRDAVPEAATVEPYGDGEAVGPFEAVHLPGHAADNHALVDEGRGVVVTGDAVCGADQRGLPAGYLLLPPARFSEDLNAAEASLERLLDYEFDAALVFHGSSVHEDARAVLERFVEFR